MSTICMGSSPISTTITWAKIVPAMQDLRDEGLIRYIGVTENWSGDLEHKMLARACAGRRLGCHHGRIQPAQSDGA